MSASKLPSLPRMVCQHFEMLPVAAADAESGFWGKIPPAFLQDAVTGDAPKQATWVKTAWSKNAFCVLFHASDVHAWATLTNRDDPLYTEEVVEVFLDPFGDLESYFEIEVNPLNAVCDLVLRRTRSGYKKDFAWDCENLQTVVTKTAVAWIVEISIPFESLGPNLPAPGMPWRVNFLRIDRPENAPRELSAWSPTGHPNFHVQERFGFLQFEK